MGNGSHKLGPALADRVREAGAKHQRMLQHAIDEERARNLPPYRDEMDSEVTANIRGITARLGLPRPARLAIGIALAIVIAAFGIGAVVVAVLRLI